MLGLGLWLAGGGFGGAYFGASFEFTLTVLLSDFLIRFWAGLAHAVDSKNKIRAG